MMGVELLPALRKVCVALVGDDTLEGCCGHVALLVQSMCGGDLVERVVPSPSDSIGQHFWNRLPDGTEIDLTSSQFGGDGWNPMFDGRVVLRPELFDPEHIAFAMAVLEKSRAM